MKYISISFIKFLISSTVFFVEASKKFIGKFELPDILHYPFAYAKYMKTVIKEYRKEDEYPSFAGKDI